MSHRLANILGSLPETTRKKFNMASEYAIYRHDVKHALNLLSKRHKDREALFELCLLLEDRNSARRARILSESFILRAVSFQGSHYTDKIVEWINGMNPDQRAYALSGEGAVDALLIERKGAKLREWIAEMDNEHRALVLSGDCATDGRLEGTDHGLMRRLTKNMTPPQFALIAAA